MANEYFVTPHGLTAQHAAAMFGIGYFAPTSVDEFEEQFNAACFHSGCTIIEVITPPGQGAKSIDQAVSMVRML